MTLETYAYLGEIIAAIAVIASLIYVARQLGQTTAMMRVNASNERVARDTEIITSIIESREIAEFWMKGATEIDSLDDTDRQRLIFFERRAITHWHNMFGLREQNLILDADWYELKWIIQNIGHRQAIRETWSIFKDSFQNPFQEFIEEQFAIADGALDRR